MHRSHYNSFLPLLVALCTFSNAWSFSIIHVSPNRSLQRISFTTCQAKGFGSGSGGGFGTKPAKNKKPSKQAVAKKIQKKYGGTTAKEIAQGTQKQIEKAMKNLPPHLQVATQLYQQLQKWDSRLSTMSILEQANIPQPEVHGAKRARDELERIYKEHDITEVDLHNIFQKVTWDASADAKAARALTGDMPKDIAERIDKACKIVGEAVRQSASSKPRCLDVGCGFGVLVPHLMKAGGLDPSEIFGIDLSPEMIRNACEQHDTRISFEAVDFLNEYTGPKDEDGKFDSVIFCSALHDMPDQIAALKKAASLLRSSGSLVIVHAQGALHVAKQVTSNPVLVKRGLPTAAELQSIGADLGLTLISEPAGANTPQDVSEGYLAVLQKQ